MKKVFVFALIGGMFALVSCGGGPSAEEKAAAEQAAKFAKCFAAFENHFAGCVQVNVHCNHSVTNIMLHVAFTALAPPCLPAEETPEGGIFMVIISYHFNIQINLGYF